MEKERIDNKAAPSVLRILAAPNGDKLSQTLHTNREVNPTGQGS